MPQITTWQIKVGRYSGGTLTTTDHASRTLGLFIDQQCDPGQLGTGRATITLDNSDGELTPAGSGTYANVDWLTSGLFIDATVDIGTVPVFHGIITDFRLEDDGDGRSVVTLDALDAFQVIGFQDRFTVGVGTNSTSSLLYYIMSSHITANETQVPTLGLPAMRVWWESLNDSTEDVPHFLPSATHVLGDVISNNIMPNQQTVAFPTILDDSGTYSAYDSWTGFTVDGLARSGVSATGNVFVFANVDPMPVNILPFRSLKRDFHNDLITNSAKITALNTSTSETYDDDASRERYGTRSRIYDITAFNDAQVLTTAQLWVNRYSYKETFDMTASSLQVTDSMVQGHGGDEAKWRGLLDVTAGWWETGSVAYTPTGGTARTDAFIIAGRTIEATPADTVVTLKVRPQSIYLAFILDDADRGVLGANSLG